MLTTEFVKLIVKLLIEHDYTSRQLNDLRWQIEDEWIKQMKEESE